MPTKKKAAKKAVRYLRGECVADDALPCPWCGEKPCWRDPKDWHPKWMLCCDNPTCAVRPYGATGATQKITLKVWNTRKS